MATAPKSVRCLVLCDIPALGLKCGQVADVPPAVAKAHAGVLDSNEAAVASAGAVDVVKLGTGDAPAADPETKPAA